MNTVTHVRSREFALASITIESVDFISRGRRGKDGLAEKMARQDWRIMPPHPQPDFTGAHNNCIRFDGPEVVPHLEVFMHGEFVLFGTHIQRGNVLELTDGQVTQCSRGNQRDEQLFSRSVVLATLNEWITHPPEACMICGKDNDGWEYTFDCRRARSRP